MKQRRTRDAPENIPLDLMLSSAGPRASTAAGPPMTPPHILQAISSLWSILWEACSSHPPCKACKVNRNYHVHLWPQKLKIQCAFRGWNGSLPWPVGGGHSQEPGEAWTSPVVPWLRTHLPVRGDTGLIPGQEDLTCPGQLSPCHNHWACALEPGTITITEPTISSTSEKPTQNEDPA